MSFMLYVYQIFFKVGRMTTENTLMYLMTYSVNSHQVSIRVPGLLFNKKCNVEPQKPNVFSHGHHILMIKDRDSKW